jgi:hypothetical protein
MIVGPPAKTMAGYPRTENPDPTKPYVMRKPLRTPHASHVRRNRGSRSQTGLFRILPSPVFPLSGRLGTALGTTFATMMLTTLSLLFVHSALMRRTLGLVPAPGSPQGRNPSFCSESKPRRSGALALG